MSISFFKVSISRMSCSSLKDQVRRLNIQSIKILQNLFSLAADASLLWLFLLPRQIIAQFDRRLQKFYRNYKSRKIFNVNPVIQFTKIFFHLNQRWLWDAIFGDPKSPIHIPGIGDIFKSGDFYPRDSGFLSPGMEIFWGFLSPGFFGDGDFFSVGWDIPPKSHPCL